MTRYRAYILAKNEAPNIDRCIKSLHALGLQVTVLDSGSTDGTLDIVEKLGAEKKSYDYRDHCKAYNDVTAMHSAHVGSIVLDADMIVPPEVWQQAKGHFEAGNSVISAPVAMVCSGRILEHASLYPPKPFLFRGGTEYFRPMGHGEVLKDGVEVRQVAGRLIHDDRKPFERWLDTQQKYARKLAARVKDGHARLLDRVRLYTPLTVVMVAPYILLGRLGILDGFAGLQYAVERMITEAVIWRQGIRSLLTDAS